MTRPLRVAATVERDAFTLALDVDVRPGEVLGVVGPNGAGKTTLLRTIAGLTPVSSGSVAAGDEILDDASVGTFVPPERRPVAVVFQDYRLFPHLSVLDNVAFAARCRGRRRSTARTDARQWVDRLDLTDIAERRPAQLSGGQAQRVALARALAAEPDVLLLDEPLAALDARTRLDVRTGLRRHLAEFPGVCVLVTHDPLEALVLTDRLLVLEGGRVTQLDSPAEVAARPASAYVASLMGLNLYAGRSGADRTVTLDAGGVLVAPGGAPTGPVLVTVPPAAVALYSQEPPRGSPRNVWRGVVSGVELMGDRVRVHVDGRPPVFADVTAAAVAELRLAPGVEVWLAVKSTEIDVYAEPAPAAATGGTGRDGELLTP